MGSCGAATSHLPCQVLLAVSAAGGVEYVLNSKTPDSKATGSQTAVE